MRGQGRGVVRNFSTQALSNESVATTRFGSYVPCPMSPARAKASIQQISIRTPQYHASRAPAYFGSLRSVVCYEE